jgi:hypothetical protein
MSIDIQSLISQEFHRLIKILPKNYQEVKVLGNILNLEEYFNSITSPIIINNIPHKSKYIDIITSYICDINDRSSLIISCKCGKYTGFFYEGKICEECNTEVVSNLVTNLKNEVWIQIPPSIGKVLNPMAYLVISDVLKHGNSSIKSYLEYVLNPNKPLPDDLKPYFKDQGFKYFYENFDYVIDVFLNRYPKTKNRKMNSILKVFIEKFRDRLFTGYLPVLSKFLQPSNQKPGSNRIYVDKSLKEILKSIISLVMSKYAYILDKNYKSVEKLMWKTYSSYINYYYEVIKTKFSKKKSYFRKNIFGSRLHFTFRNVIAPVNDVHIGDEIHIPWKTGLNTFMFHVINILVNRMSFTPINAYNFIMDHFYQYHPLLDQIFQLLILESYFKGLPVLQNRNPSLLTSNIILHFVTKVKPQIYPISKRFIQNFSNLDINKLRNSNEIYYSIEDIFTSRLTIVDDNDYDTINSILDYNYDKIVVPNGFTYSKEKLNHLISDKTVQVSYLDLKQLNGDYDGSTLTFPVH